jgi:hypothetical protein
VGDGASVSKAPSTHILTTWTFFCSVRGGGGYEKEHNGTEWNGMERNGTEWNGMERKTPFNSLEKDLERNSFATFSNLNLNIHLSLSKIQDKESYSQF